jgi:hypothetical protein
MGIPVVFKTPPTWRFASWGSLSAWEFLGEHLNDRVIVRFVPGAGGKATGMVFMPGTPAEARRERRE